MSDFGFWKGETVRRTSARSQGKSLVARLAGLGAVVCLGSAIVPAADAQPPGGYDYFNTVQLNAAQTVADGLACGGPLAGAATTARDKPGELYVYVRGSFFGISWNPGQSCLVNATLSWRNLDTNETGTVSGRVGRPWGPPPFSPDPVGRQISTTLSTGSGTVDLTLSSNRPHLSTTTRVEVF